MIHKEEPIKQSELECTNCKLCKSCRFTNKMDASGSSDPTWLFVGEAPGETEDREGLQFVGKAGEVIRRVLRELGYDMSKVAFTNACRCWPGEGNPTPSDSEIRACKPYLLEDIERLNPKVVVMLGAIALKAASGKTGITSLRGTAWQQNERYYIPTFHPSATFYDPDKLRAIIDDIAKAKLLPTEGIAKPEDVDWTIIDDYDTACEILELLKSFEDTVYFDYETNTNKPWREDAKILTVAYSWQSGTAVCIPLFHKDSPFSEDQVNSLISNINEMHIARNESGYAMGAYNAVFDIMFGYVAHNITMPILGDDPYLAHHLIKEEMSKPSLSQLTWMYLPIGGYDSELLSMKKETPDLYDPDKGGNYGNFPLNVLGYYNAGDADATGRLGRAFHSVLEREGLLDVYHSVTLPSTFPILEYIKNGMAVDFDFLDLVIGQYAERMNSIVMDCRELPHVKKWEKQTVTALREAWEAEERERLANGKRPRKPKTFSVTFDPNKDAHVRGVLFDVARIRSIKKTEKGMDSVDKEVRAELMNAHPLVPLIDEYAKLEKFFSSYAKRFKAAEDEPNKLFHPSYDITGTVTGRLVGDMQQLPRSSTNKDVKKLFVSRFEGGVLLNMDVKQAEIRMFAITSKDPNLIRIFKEGKDPHSMAACMVYNLDYDDFISKLKNKDSEEKEMRDRMKSAVSFGLLYGRQADALAEDFGWSIPEAERFIRKYFSMFPKVRDIVTQYKMFASSNGYITNMFGRRRRVPSALKSANAPQFERERALRQAVNFVIQSSMHDLTLFASAQICSFMKQLGMRSLMIGEVHDSLIFDVHKDEVFTICELIQLVFSNLHESFEWVTVPMEVEIAVGKNLIEMEQIVG